MGYDSDDRLLRSGVGINEKHEKIVNNRLMLKSFLPSFNYDDTNGLKYHYTSPQGLKGILSTRTLFFTDSQFLNDFREKININSELELFWHNYNKRYDVGFLNLLKRIRVTNYEDSGFSYIDRNTDELCRYFVLSLSTNGDSLSMWKYYTKTNDYDGYCLELFNMALSDEWIDRITGVAVIASQIKYYSDEKQQILLDIIDRLYRIWKSYQFSEMLDKKIIQEFTSWISIEALFFKDECFEDERETRYVAIVPRNELYHLYYEYNGVKYKMYDFRIVNGAFIPFIKMPFNDWNLEECWAIRSIRIGPSSNARQKEAGLKQFIMSLDYKMADFKLLQSDIPVRY